jgi:hypothetical protein
MRPKENIQNSNNSALLKTIKYGPSLLYSYYAYLFCGLLIAGTAVVNSLNQIEQGALRLSSLTIGVLSITFLAGIYLMWRAHFHLLPLKHLKIRVYSNRLEIEKLDREEVLYFSQIDSLEFDPFPHSAGTVVVKNRHHSKFVFDIGLDHFNYLLRAFRSARPDIKIDEAKYDYYCDLSARGLKSLFR